MVSGARGSLTDGLQINLGKIGGVTSQVPDPNEYLIQLVASAVRMHWSPRETRNREAFTRARATLRTYSMSDDFSGLTLTDES